MTLERFTATGTRQERELLQSALQDRAAPGAKAQLAAVLAGGATLAATAAAEGASLASGASAGAGGAATGATATGAVVAGAGGGGVGTATGAVVAGAGGGVGTATGGASSIGLFAVAKWVGVGVLAGTTTTAVVATTAAPPPVESEDAVPVATTTPAVSPLRPQPEDPGTVLAPTRPLAEDPATAPSARPRVGDEIEVLDRVRTALRQGSAAEAGRLLGEYRRSFPQGVMRPEATVLDVQVALARGDRERAASLARSFLVRQGDSPHAPRMRALLARAAMPGGNAVAGEPRVVTPAPSPTLPAVAAPANDETSTATPSRTPSVARFED